jgi:hypothetical protein
MSIKWAGCAALLRWRRSAYGKPEEKRQLCRPTSRWENSIKIDLNEMGLESLDWINIAQGTDWWLAIVKTGMILRVP